MSAIDTLLDNNARYAADFTSGDLANRPQTRVAIVACMDARLRMGRMLGIEEGDAHVIRNAGGSVTEDVIRSLTISQRLLGTTEVMLIHHTGCGMEGCTDDELKLDIEKDTGLRPAFAMETFPDAEADVRQSMARLHASPFLPHKDGIRGFVYDVETGQLREVK
jgi:carbonic anhydrase